MDLSEIQKAQARFTEKMGWTRFNPTQVFAHLIEELGEIVRHFLYEEKYKVKGAGHSGAEGDLGQEFAQALNLLIQLANHAGVDLEEEWKKEQEELLRRFDPEQWQGFVRDEQDEGRD